LGKRDILILSLFQNKHKSPLKRAFQTVDKLGAGIIPAPFFL
jgi:hypothetical protein